MFKFHDFSFGATSAVMTSLAVIIGLSSTDHAKTAIIASLVLIAIADNISDSFGIHIYQESQSKSPKQVRRTTFNNFAIRLVVVSIYVLIVLFASIGLAVILSIILSALIIIALSYFIAKYQKIRPFKAIIQHTTLAAIIIIASFLLRGIIQGLH